MATISRELPAPREDSEPTVSNGIQPDSISTNYRNRVHQLLEQASKNSGVEALGRPSSPNLTRSQVIWSAIGSLAATAAIVGMSYFISNGDPQIQNMRVETPPTPTPTGVMMADGFHSTTSFGNGSLEEVQSSKDQSVLIYTGNNDANGKPEGIWVTKNATGSVPAKP